MDDKNKPIRGPESRKRDETFELLSRKCFIMIETLKSERLPGATGSGKDLLDFCYKLSNMAIGRGTMCEPMCYLLFVAIDLSISGKL